MDRAGLDQNALADLWLETGQMIVGGFRGEGAQVVGAGVGFQPGVDAALRIGLQHHPGLGLAGVALGDQVFLVVLRMHLNRQHFVHVEKLQQQRKTVEPIGVVAEDRAFRRGHQLCDGGALHSGPSMTLLA